MALLYHGGTEIIHTPEIRTPNRSLDFGAGFYLTTSETQATNWVKRRAGMTAGTTVGYVNHYSLDLDAAKSVLNVKVFDCANDEWLDFVMSNRKDKNFSHNYDIVIGPVANDRVYTAFALYEGGTIGRDTLIQELKTYRLVDQYLFHTPKSLEFLSFINAVTVEL